MGVLRGEGAVVSLAKWTANLSWTLQLPLCQYLGVVTSNWTHTNVWETFLIGNSMHVASVCLTS